MNVATFKLTLALPVEEAPIGSMLAFLEETVKIDPKNILGVQRIGVKLADYSQGFGAVDLPLFEVTVTEETVAFIADWFYRTVESFEMDFEVEWKVYAGV